MMKSAKRFAVRLVRSLVSKLWHRQLVFRPIYEDADQQNDDLLPLRYTYRASPEGNVSYCMQVTAARLSLKLYAMTFTGTRPTQGPLCLSLEIPSVSEGDILRVNLSMHQAWHNDTNVCVESVQKQPGRKCIAVLQVTTRNRTLTRRCSHYLPFTNKDIGKDYYYGDDYTSYPLHTNTGGALALVQNYCPRGRLLDVGCALGLYTQAFVAAGFDAYGVDISSYAVTETEKRVGRDRVRQGNLDQSEIPFGGKFDVVWMWDVLEHSTDPESLLHKVTTRSNSGGYLFLRTSNADSLTHRILEEDWEGFSDYSHHGVQKVSPANLKAWLSKLNWDILHWNCDGVWFAGVDPVLSCLKSTFAEVPELAMLLSERDLGDSLQVVARKREARDL